MNLVTLAEQFAVIKMKPSATVPEWVYENKQFVSITFTDEELSIVCPEKVIPNTIDATVEMGWSGLKVEGELDFSLTGILANLANTLADADVSIFALSTYNTDYLLVKTQQLNQAINALQANGHQIERKV